MTNGHYYAPGSDGYAVNGPFCIVKGGNFGHCKNTARVVTRWVFDVVSRNPRVGFRLAHDVV
jgi:hypothetical protein